MTATVSFPRRDYEAVLDGPSLLDAAARAEEETVMLAIGSGADLNISDALGRTIVSCIIGGESWVDADASDASYTLQTRLSMLQKLLHHNDVSLYTLNVPVSRVTPLSLAAWLNSPDIVRLLLEESHGMVLVDSIDTHGGTPLMYAARDGRYEVVSALLEHGARPDRRDAHHRSSIQYALPHPRVLQICEAALRRYRTSEPARSRNLVSLPELFRLRLLEYCSSDISDAIASKTGDKDHHPSDDFLQAVRSSNLSALYSLLLPSSPNDSAIDLTLQCMPPLINIPYPDGWSLLHYCVSSQRPSVGVLDVLYRMGADVGLYTLSAHGTPLHCLAHSATTTQSDAEGLNVRSFVYHFVHDLGAPLAAKDANENTCIHIAAARSESSLDVLMAFLACDTDGRIRAMRNAKGMTAWDLASPEFRTVFELDSEQLQALSSSAVRMLTPSAECPLQRMPSLSSLASSLLFSQPSPALEDDELELHLTMVPHRILSTLQLTARELVSPSTVDIGACRWLLRETAALSADLLERLRAHVHDAEAELAGVCKAFTQMRGFLADVSRVVEERLTEFLPTTEECGWGHCDCPRRRARDSQATAVSDDLLFPRRSRSMSELRARSSTMGSDRTAISLPESRERSSSLSRPVVDSSLPASSSTSEEPRPPTPPPKETGRKRSKSDIRSLAPLQGLDKLLLRDAPRSALSPTATSKIKQWFRKKISGGAVEHAGTAPSSATVSRVPSLSRKRSLSTQRRECDPVMDAKWRAAFGCRRCLSAAAKDMVRIEKCMDATEKFIASAHRYIAQAERALDSAMLSRKASLECARIRQLHDYLEEGTPKHGTVEISSPRTNSPKVSLDECTPSTTARSSVVSLCSTLVDVEDHDIRVLRRLLGRKIEAQTEGAFQEIDRIMIWLRIVRDALRGIKQRTTSLVRA